MAIQDDFTMTIKRFTTLALAFFAFSQVQAQEPIQLVDEIIAVVDDDIIMASELQLRTQSVKSQNQGVDLSDLQALEAQVLEKMIVESIQLQMADRGGIRVSESQLNDAMSRIARQNNMTLEQFQQNMAGEGVSYAYAREQIRNEIRISRVQQYQVSQTIQITDQDIDFFLESDLGKLASAAEYRLGHILIAVPSSAGSQAYQDAEGKAKGLVSDLRQGGDFGKTAMTHSKSSTALKGGDLGWRKEGQLPGLFAEYVPKMEIGDISDPIRTASGFHIIKVIDKRGGNVQMVEQTNTRHILIQTNEVRDELQSEELINQLHQRALAGEDFAELAKEFSDDPGSGANGGDLGWVSAGEMVPKFEQAMLSLETGKISAPVKTQFGWHILEVLERREMDMGKEMQRNQVRQLLFSRRFEEELPIWLRKIRSEAYVDLKGQS